MVHSGGPPSMPGAGENQAHPSNPLSHLIAGSPATGAGARANQQALLGSNGHLGPFSRGAWRFGRHANLPGQLPATNAFPAPSFEANNRSLPLQRTVPPPTNIFPAGSLETDTNDLFEGTVPPATNTFPLGSLEADNNGFLFGSTVPPATNTFPLGSLETDNDGRFFGSTVPPATNTFPPESLETDNSELLSTMLAATDTFPAGSLETNNTYLLSGSTVPPATYTFPAGSFETDNTYLLSGSTVPPATNTFPVESLETDNTDFFGSTVPPVTNTFPPGSLETSNLLLGPTMPPATNTFPAGSLETDNNPLFGHTMPPATNTFPAGSFETNNNVIGRTVLPPLPSNGPRSLLFSTQQRVQVQPSHHVVGNGAGALLPLPPRSGARLPPQTWAAAPNGGSAGAEVARLPADQGVARFAPQPASLGELIGNSGASQVRSNRYVAWRSASPPVPRLQPPCVRAAVPASLSAFPQWEQEAPVLDGRSIEEFLVERGVVEGPVSGLVAGRPRRLSTLVAGLRAVLSAERTTSLGAGTARVTEASSGAAAVSARGTRLVRPTAEETSAAAAVGARGTRRLRPTAEETSAAATVGGRGTPRLRPTAEETSAAAAVGGRGTLDLRRLMAEEAMPSSAASSDRDRAVAGGTKERRMKKTSKTSEAPRNARTLAAARGSAVDGSGGKGPSGPSSSSSKN